MPVSKIDWVRYKGLDITPQGRIRMGLIPKAEIGNFMAYSLDLGKQWRVALVHEVDEGYVTAVRHLDGSVLSLKEENGARRLIALNHKLIKPPEEVLRLVGDLRVEGLEPLKEAVRPYSRKLKKAKVSGPAAK